MYKWPPQPSSIYYAKKMLMENADWLHFGVINRNYHPTPASSLATQPQQPSFFIFLLPLLTSVCLLSLYIDCHELAQVKCSILQTKQKKHERN